ncbi:PalA [candidate division MSBL1 archaeon SCGC-AAA259D18]|uniref:PalA n=1 Tax=candidate division MSBL1 archaeon SCGC-AAA259D18 TaxID=1698262 RepID=A0A133UCB4_9EURY|nr:PalA [candidate division MSBL1 archaeon SCGC-AAA259D18]
MTKKIHVTMWNEFKQEKSDEEVKKIYPDGIHETIAGFLRKRENLEVETATLDEPKHGLTEKTLKLTDVLIWWSHTAHDEIGEKIVNRVQRRVLEGMGLIVLHSSHFSKIFKRLMGTSCRLKWREADENEILWMVQPDHPIAEGIKDHIDLEEEETYGEPFDIPPPHQLIFISWFSGGEVFRSGCTFRRGRGKIFYFRPGHETNPTYHNPQIQRVISNAVYWASPKKSTSPACQN